MTCRKRRDVVETGLQSLAWDEARGVPADCPSGDRHGGGERPARGSCVERGNLGPDASGLQTCSALSQSPCWPVATRVRLLRYPGQMPRGHRQVEPYWTKDFPPIA